MEQNVLLLLAMLMSDTEFHIKPEWVDSLAEMYAAHDRATEACREILRGVDHPTGRKRTAPFYEAVQWAQEVARRGLG